MFIKNFQENKKREKKFSRFFYFSTFSNKISGKIVFRVFNLFILFSGKNFFPTVCFFFISVVELFRQNVCFFNSGDFFLLKLVLFCFILVLFFMFSHKHFFMLEVEREDFSLVFIFSTCETE